MNIGDEIKCSNGHTYTLGEGDGYYNLSIIDEFGEVVNYVMDYYLNACLPELEEEQQALCVGEDIHRNLVYTRITEYKPNKSSLSLG